MSSARTESPFGNILQVEFGKMHELQHYARGLLAGIRDGQQFPWLAAGTCLARASIPLPGWDLESVQTWQCHVGTGLFLLPISSA